MPEYDDEAVREKYGLKSKQESPTRSSNDSSTQSRNFNLERNSLLLQFEKLGQFYLTKGQEYIVVDNTSANAEEFCTIIELALDHGLRCNTLGRAFI